MLLRVGVLLAGVLLCLLGLPGAASAAPCLPAVCSPEPSTPPPTPSHSPTPSPTASPRPSATKSSAYSPRPQATHTPSARRTTAAPTTDGSSSTDSPFSTVQPVKVAPVGKAATGSGRVDKLVALILGGAALLGVGGISGLYLTRERA